MIDDKKELSPTRVLYLSHGGGPLPLLGDAGHVELVNTLQKIAASMLKPSAIVVISAHWEEENVTITAAKKPQLIYDYGGFPKAAYALAYPALGEPELAREIQAALCAGGVEAELDEQRGWDHGMFVPLKIMYPEADVPCVQLSLLHSMDAAAHLSMGEVIAERLAALNQDNLLIVGSGFSFHNMQAFFESPHAASQRKNEAFEAWLMETCASRQLSEVERRERWLHWEQAPFARYCHPREEHLLPLHVCYGVAGRACREVFEMKVMGKKASMYLW